MSGKSLMARLFSAPLVALTLTAGCGDSAEVRPARVAAELGRTASSARGMVVSSSGPAAAVGAEILARGGNAVDAAVATAFALAVVEPTQSGLGGRTQALVWRPGSDPIGVDGTTVVPAAYEQPADPLGSDGYPVIAIPGTVAALARLMDEAGSMSWADVIEPALELAESGFPLTGGEAGRLSGIRDRLLLSEAASSALLRPDGTALAAGERLVQPVLARVLRSLAAEGPRVFYEGWIAEAMAEDFAAHGAAVTAADLSGYTAENAIVVRGTFGDLDLVGTYLPASGATTIEALQILDRLDLDRLDSDDRVITIGEALLAAFEDREAARADARLPEVDAAWITSPALASTRAAEIDVRFGVGNGEESAERLESSHTSHISVLDDEGMAVAMTQSLGPTGGSRVATPGLGFLHAATLGYLEGSGPSDRLWSSQSPLIALEDARVTMVLGGAGGRRIVSALVQTLVRLELEGASLDEAMSGPRFHPTGRWHFEQVDPAREPVGAALARARGQTVLVRPFDYYFGRLNVIRVDDAGVMAGAADPRWEWGVAAGPESVGR